MFEPFIQGISIKGYRSFKEEVIFDNLGKINLIIGQNNSGKSNLLRFLSKHLLNLTQDGRGVPFSDIDDAPRHDQNKTLEVGIKISRDSGFLHKISDGNNVQLYRNTIFKNNQNIWFYYSKSGDKFECTDTCINKTLTQIGDLKNEEWQNLWHILSRMRGGDLRTWKKESISRFNPASRILQIVDLIPAIRSLKKFEYDGSITIEKNGRIKNGSFGIHSGIHLTEELFKLERPNITEYRKDKERFSKINNFMRDIIGNNTLTLEVPHDKKMVLVEMDNKVLPITALGSGIEEILIIAAKCTMFTNQIVCIEEPELHLHPTLQRKLIRYLHDETDNQYFIATHSAHLLDACSASIYHIKLENGYSKVISAVSDQDKFEACYDLGYKASDLLQANFIIWVEGPSDRIYLNHWIDAFVKETGKNELVEGLHYSIMFYGGGLLNHLSASDSAIQDFISLHKLNQNMAILIDSDRKKKGENINNTKNRIKKEFEDRNQFVWITAGKEIENYLPKNLYEDAVKKTHKSVKQIVKASQYENMTIFYLNSRKTDDSKRNIDKIKLANVIKKEKANLDVLDLRQQIKKLVGCIEKANLLDV